MIIKGKRKPKARGYVRPSRARSRSGWSVRQLAELTGVPVRTIKSSVSARVLRRSPFKGPGTPYQRPQLLALLAIRQLREVEELSLAEIRKRLQGMSAKELEAPPHLRHVATPSRRGTRSHCAGDGLRPAHAHDRARLLPTATDVPAQ
jgi:DNA-binding transcriptional MerR regulator